jgi:hypothetical protein
MGQASKRIISGIKNIDKVSEGLFNYKNPSEKIEALATERAKICVSCPNYKDEPIKQLQLDDEIKVLSKKMCTLCGCVLSLKLRTRIISTNQCPLKND